MKRIFFSFIFLLCALSQYAQPSPSWQANHNSPSSISVYPVKMVADDQGNTYVTGYGDFVGGTQFNWADYDIYVSKYSNTGTLLWTKTYAGAGLDEDKPTDIGVDKDGNIFVVGSEYNIAWKQRALTLKYDSNGNLIWSKNFTTTNNSSKYKALSLAIDTAGTCYVCGYSESTNYMNNGFVIGYRYDGSNIGQSEGNNLSLGESIFNSVTVDNLGNVYVAGSEGPSGSRKTFIGKYAKNLNNNFYKVSNNPYGDEEGEAICVDQNQNIFVSGYAEISVGGFQGQGILVRKLDNNGITLWTKQSGYRNGEGKVNRMAIDTSSGIIALTGMIKNGYAISAGTNLTRDAFTIAYNSNNGNTLFTNTYDGATSTHDYGKDLSIKNDKVYVLASSDETGNKSEVTFIKIDVNGTVDFANTFSGTSAGTDSNPISIFADNNGKVYTYSQFSNALTGLDAQLNTYNTFGTLQWYNAFDGTGNFYDWIKSVATDNNGNVYITGTSSNGIGYDMTTIKYNKGGVKQWIKYFNGVAKDSDFGSNICVDKNGNAIATGMTLTSTDKMELVTIKYDPNGNIIWTKLYSGSDSLYYFEHAPKITSDINNNIYVAGQIFNGYSNSRFDLIVLKYDANGNLNWSQTYNGAGDDDDAALDITTDTLGNVYITGYLNDGQNNYKNVTTIKLDSQGNEIWKNNYNGTDADNDAGFAITTDKNLNVYVTGFTYDLASQADYLTLKYNSAGVFQWAKTHNGSLNAEDVAYDIVCDATGNIYVTGDSRFLSTGSNIYTIKYNSNGVAQWNHTINGSANDSDFVKSIALDMAGNVIVSGGVFDSQYYNFVTAKINAATGTEIWKTEFDGPAASEDVCYGMITDTKGGIYVFGESVVTGAYTDMMLVKYCDLPTKIITPSQDTSICSGTPYQLTATSGASSYSWSPSGSGNSISASTSGAYYVEATYSNGCATTSDTVSINVLPAPTASVNINGPTVFCKNGSSNLTTLTALPNSGVSYQWSNGSTSSLIMVGTSGNYYVVVTDNNGCKDTSSTTTIQANQIPTIPICLVTVNDASDANIIVWEKPQSGADAIDSIRIYRELTTNNFVHIASVDGAELSEYTDTAADPNVTRYRYAIAVLDTCGGLSSLSAPHATIHLQYLGSGNLQWTQYEGQLVTNYSILRDDNQSGTFNPISSTIPQSNTTYTDINYNSYPNAVYRLEVVWGLTCTSTMKTLAGFNTSKSNIKNLSVGVDQLTLEKETSIFPNPAKGNVNIQTPMGVNAYQLFIYNTLGEQVINFNATDNNFQTINTSTLSTGVYNMIIRTEKAQINKKLIIQ